MRFRDEELTFHISDTFDDRKDDKTGAFKYPKVFYMIILDVQETRRFRAHYLARIIQDLPNHCFAGRKRYRKNNIHQDVSGSW
jgi:hypothetical protein